MGKKSTSVSVANAKRQFSDLLGRVAYGGESILITRRGRPMAKLVPIDEPPFETSDLVSRGWLEEDDVFFEIVEDIIAERERHKPRALVSRNRAGSKRRTR